MHHCIRAKWPPRLRAGLGGARRAAERLLDAEVRGRKRIRQVQRAHREVVRGPRPDAGQLDEPRDERLEIVRTFDRHGSGRDGRGERVQCGRAHGG